MKMRKNLVLFVVAFVMAACSTVNTGNMASSQGKWQFWQGRGNAQVQVDSVIYEPENLQDEEYDYDVEGRGPALILSRIVPGKKWQLDLKPQFFSLDKTYNRFSFGLWIGDSSARPSIGSKMAKAVLAVSRTRGPEKGDNALKLIIREKEDPKTISLSLLTSDFRFEREKNEIIVYVSEGYVVRYKEIARIPIPRKGTVSFFVGARYDGVIFGEPRMILRNMTLNGEGFFE